MKAVRTRTLDYQLNSCGIAGINCYVQHEENDSCFCQVLSDISAIVTPYVNASNQWCALIYNCRNDAILKDTLQIKFTIIKHQTN